MYNVHWWGSDGTAKNQRAMDDAPDEANHIGFYSLLARPEITTLYNSLENRYEDLTKQQYSSYQAYSYDISLVISNTIYQTQSTAGAVLVPLQKPTADRTFGATGSCRLDEFGDRLGPSYDIWWFEPSATKASVSRVVGQYNPDAEEMKEGEGTIFFPESNWGIHVPGP
jgi:ABC-type branched-subunit amino acid transport system substrate-binding protein